MLKHLFKYNVSILFEYLNKSFNISFNNKRKLMYTGSGIFVEIVD